MSACVRRKSFGLSAFDHADDLDEFFGGSLGREGVAVQIGATLSHRFARHIGFQMLRVSSWQDGSRFAALQTPLAATFLLLRPDGWGAAADGLYPALIVSIASLPLWLWLREICCATKRNTGAGTPETLDQSCLSWPGFWALLGNSLQLAFPGWRKQSSQVLLNPYTRIVLIGAGLSLVLLTSSWPRSALIVDLEPIWLM